MVAFVFLVKARSPGPQKGRLEPIEERIKRENPPSADELTHRRAPPRDPDLPPLGSDGLFLDVLWLRPNPLIPGLGLGDLCRPWRPLSLGSRSSMSIPISRQDFVIGTF